MTTWITICDTCKRVGWEAGDMSQTDGERLAAEIEQIATQQGDAKIRTRRMSCLMGCANGCNVAIQAHGKLAYTLGDFEPTAENAAAIFDYAQRHQESETGVVAYGEWPEEVKGHFVTRHPPLPEAE